jgi:hypothetical protein
MAAILAVVVALRRSRVPVIAGRALCVIAAAPVVALTGIAGAPAGAAVAAGVCSLLLVTALTAAWEHIGRGRRGTVLAAFSLGVAGSLPIGFGITALILELSATVSIGRPGTAAAAVQAATRVLISAGNAEQHRYPSVLGTVAAVVSLIAAVVPGTVATWVLAALNSTAITEPIGAAAIRSNAGDWSGGYIVVAFVIVAAGVWAFATLQGWSLVTAPPTEDRPSAPAVRAVGVRIARRLRPAAVRGNSWLRQTDDWLVVQPQLVVVLGGAILAILLFQLIH